MDWARFLTNWLYAQLRCGHCMGERRSKILEGWNNALFLHQICVPEASLMHMQDRFATARAQPPIDDIQNVRLLSFSEADGMTTLEFKRDLEAFEPKDRSIEVIAQCKFYV